ncbi:MAG TPA: Clp protease N-terminal domain-containing protein [Candidatus Baltobacteraceae bacterium]|nr:Clp protease N-terminal domain-containing protein [Candidatus Baltobacteraceae bacterium]
MTTARWDDTVSNHFKMVLSAADALATKAREEVGTDHLLLAVSYQNGPLWRAVIRDMMLDPFGFRSHVESFVDAHSQAQTAAPGPSGLLSPESSAVFGEAIAHGNERGATSVLNVGTLLLGLASEKGGRVAHILAGYGINAVAFRDAVKRNLVRETDEL